MPPTAGSIVVLVLAWLLFPVTVSLILGLFAEEVITLVERRHYPGLPSARGMSFGEQMASGARFLLVALPLNFDGEKPRIRRAPPTLGEHNAEIRGHQEGRP